MTALTKELENARRRVVSDGYEMSVGELMGLYRDKELIINPAYQRYFRWDDSQKTGFIESLLLGIPTPPIFVFQQADGTWELIDGLQRLSTVLEFVGHLRNPNGGAASPSSLEGTNLVPTLAGATWQTLPNAQKLDIKRSRIRVEILKKESDDEAKFDLFQRLNTGGSLLSRQELRNCVLVMISPDVHDWLRQLTEYDKFATTVGISDAKKQEQQDMEIALRYIAYRHRKYRSGLDVHQYLDQAAQWLARRMTETERNKEECHFHKTFDLLVEALGADAFRKWNGEEHRGPFLISGFDAIGHGVACNQDGISSLPDRASWVRKKARAIWQDATFVRYSGQVRGTTRLKHLLPFGVEYFRP